MRGRGKPLPPLDANEHTHIYIQTLSNIYITDENLCVSMCIKELNSGGEGS